MDRASVIESLHLPAEADLAVQLGSTRRCLYVIEQIYQLQLVFGTNPTSNDYVLESLTFEIVPERALELIQRICASTFPLP